MDLCQANNCPATAVYTIADAATHPHLHARGYIVELEHPVIGRVADLGAPVRLADAPGGPVTPAPLLGEHNEEIFCGQLGLSATQYRELQSTGII